MKPPRNQLPPVARPPARTLPPLLRRALAAATVALAAGLSVVAAQPTEPAEPPPSTPQGEATPADQASPPAQSIAATYPMAVLLPDSEFVYGPSLDGFDVPAFVTEAGGYLAGYQETVDGVARSGAEIVVQVSQDYSISPRLLLALIQAQSGWVQDPAPAELAFPVGEPLPGLYPGLSAAADALNGFYYGHRDQDQDTAPLAEGTVEVPGTNAATFALLAYLGRDADALEWAGLQAPSRFQGAWMGLFGDPTNYLGETALPAVPPPVTLALPFRAGEIWYFVAGPHSPWGAKGPRAAIDLAPPPAEATGCFPSGAWVTAAAPGLVTRSSASGLVVSLEGSEFEGTGWAHVYNHLSPIDRAPVGTRVAMGDRLGYPGCEGGLPTQTRVAFARKYQGAWIAAADPVSPLVLGGWTALPGQAGGEGFLIRTGTSPRVASPEKSDAGNGVTALPAPAGP